MKKILIPFFVIFFWVTSVFAGGGPVEVLQSIADQMIYQLKENKATLKTNPSLVYSLAYKIVVPRADLDEMSKRVLPPSVWNQASSSEKAQFKKEFTRLLVRTYASALAEYEDQTIKFYPVRGGVAGRNDVSVNSQIIRSDGPSIAVNYRLINQSGGWKLIDMTVEGVSLLESFRSQFADKLSQGENMEALLKDLSSHNRSRGNS